jgi:hypothetical protein
VFTRPGSDTARTHIQECSMHDTENMRKITLIGQSSRKVESCIARDVMCISKLRLEVANYIVLSRMCVDAFVSIVGRLSWLEVGDGH